MHTQHAQHKARTTGHIHIHLSPPSVSLYVVSLSKLSTMYVCLTCGGHAGGEGGGRASEESGG